MRLAKLELIIIAVVALILALLQVALSADYQFQLVKETAGYNRINIDLSLDGGITYPIKIASGIPVAVGTNQYSYSFPNNPALFTDIAKIRFQTLRARGAKTENNDTVWSDEVFTIAGVYIDYPRDGDQYTGTIPAIWISNEAGSQVQIGISTNNCRSYTLAAYADNVDGTNSYAVPVPAGMTGRATLAVVSLSDLKCHGTSKEFTIK